MQLITCGKNDSKRYIAFMKQVYRGYPNYKDSFSVLVAAVISGKSVFCKSAEIIPVMVQEAGRVVAVATYIIAQAYPQVLQLAFFEALPGYPEAVDLLIGRAKEIGHVKGIKTICIGLQGHVNNGLGILADHFEAEPLFGIAFNPPYYLDYFRRYPVKEHTLVSYCGNCAAFSMEPYQKLLVKIKRSYQFRNISFKRFRAEMELYTELNNRCFANHPFYYPRRPEEDYELFHDLKWFLREENLIFAEDQGRVIGFLLWYPDFNQLIPAQGGAGVTTVLKNRFFQHQINRVKLAEIGVLPEYMNKGVIIGLFAACYERAKGRFQQYESSWILAENYKSRNFGIKWADSEYKHYLVWELEV